MQSVTIALGSKPGTFRERLWPRPFPVFVRSRLLGSSTRIRTIVAERSPAARDLLLGILRSDPGLDVVAVARNGREVVELTCRLRPDVVVIELHASGLDAVAVTRRIMHEAPTPVVIVSAVPPVESRDVVVSMNALRAGALAVHERPDAEDAQGFDTCAQRLLATVRAMSQVKVVRRWAHAHAPSSVSGPSGPPGQSSPRRESRARLIAIAASTGGPAALEEILTVVPRGFTAPMLIVQHMAPGFIDGVASWLSDVSGHPVEVATEGAVPRAGGVYLAPDGQHLGTHPDGRLAISGEAAVDGFRPSATHLFRSVAAAYGHSAIGVILTGMGSDGVEGLRAMRRLGGRVIAQDEASSIVFGMPGAAVAAGVATDVLPLCDIPAALMDALDPEARP